MDRIAAFPHGAQGSCNSDQLAQHRVQEWAAAPPLADLGRFLRHRRQGRTAGWEKKTFVVATVAVRGSYDTIPGSETYG